VRISRTSSALRSLPALDQALSRGALTLDQVAAATEFATPETDAELARVAVGKPPSAIGLVARTLAPPVVADDQALYARRALSMSWTRGRRELAISGRLPLEQGAIFEQAIWDIAKQQRAADKQIGSVPEWQQSAADALVTLAQHSGGERDGVRRSATTLIVHLSEDAPPFLEGAGPLSPETAERLACDARRLTIKPTGRDLVHSRVGRCASYAQMRALHKRSEHCQYPGCRAPAAWFTDSIRRIRTSGVWIWRARRARPRSSSVKCLGQSASTCTRAVSRSGCVTRKMICCACA
jgi:hypothetical protein